MSRPTKDVMALSRAHTESAIKTLVGIMNEPSSPAASRVQAASALLDRGWGKAKQTIEADVTSDVVALLRAVDGATRRKPDSG